MNNIAIILAAGNGSRMSCDEKKQFLQLHNKPILYYALKAFEESLIDEIIVVTGKDDIEYCKNDIIGKYNFKKISKVIAGGSERYLSVYNAILAIDNCKNVCIHDSARPMITTELINQILEKMNIHKAIIVGMPVKDTIKMVDQTGSVMNTPDRELLWQVQTPQVFDYELIKEAYIYLIKEGIRDVTDDAMVLEKYYKGNIPIQMVEGSYENIKITTKEDLIIAEAFLNKKI